MAYEEHVRRAGAEVVRCAVVTLSDTRTEATDTSGRRIRELLEGDGHPVVDARIVPDDAGDLDRLLSDLLCRDDVDAVITNGGTGFSRRDTTIEVVERHLDRALPGFGELFRALSFQQVGSGALLSRATGGAVRDKLLFALPGSTGAVELAMTRLILPELRHLMRELRK